MRIATLILLGVCFSLLATSQEEIPQVKRCGTYEVLEGFRSLHPNAETDEHFENWLAQKIEERNQLRPQALVTLPVVFHIVHNNSAVGAGTNLLASVIRQQVMQLNKDFANHSNSPYAVSADMEIQFALAQNNPGGTLLAEPGIDRVNRVGAGFTPPPYTVGYAVPGDNYLNSVIKPATIWDPSKYINIWVVEMESGILGIATFPNSSGLSGLNPSNEDAFISGVSVAPFSVGSVFEPNGTCTSAYGKGKTLTHELGHYFGLRHIWGDANCGSDFCGDTPVHRTSNSGVPVHPKSNTCGTADEMFENYMDYCNDIALNTFTVDQKTRMQAVLTNSPYRNTLAASTAGLVPVTGNRISFYNCTGAMTVTETGSTGTYPRYKDISVVVNVEDKATANATLTINPTGTAVNGFHYQVMNPSIAFATGDDSKTITVRILDNAEVDGNKTIILGYSIAGSGIQAGATGQTMTLTITDDDNVTAANTTTTLLSENFEGTPTGWNSFITSGFPNTWGVSNNGDAGGTGRSAHITNNTTTFPNTYTKTVAAAGAAILRTPLIDANGVSDLQLTFKYKVWGESTVSTASDFGLVTYSTPAAPTTFSQVPATGSGPFAGITGTVSGSPTINLPNATFANSTFYLGMYWQNNTINGNDPPFNVDDIVLTGTMPGAGIENTVSGSYGYNVRAGTTNHFRSSNNKIIADVNNASVAISGLTVSVVQAGNGSVTVSTTGGGSPFMRSQKVIQMTPATPNTSVTYQGTLYFTTAELAVWGASISTLKILKVKDGVNLSGTLNSSNSEIITPVFSDQSASGYYTYTGNFTGFSQFMLVSPTATLPVSLLSFEASAAKNSIVLTWSTSQEFNNKGFAIERGTDGVNFEKIGWVDGVVNSSNRTDYSYPDHFVQPGVLYYYRLRQADLDGREKLSMIRQAMIDRGEITLNLHPNPSSDYLNIFISGSTASADVSLLNLQGQLTRKWRQVNASVAPLRLNISGLASGVYFLEVQLPTGKLVEKVWVR
jgi:zinc-dependent metalloproteinase lipoprotein